MQSRRLLEVARHMTATLVESGREGRTEVDVEIERSAMLISKGIAIIHDKRKEYQSGAELFRRPSICRIDRKKQETVPMTKYSGATKLGNK